MKKEILWPIIFGFISWLVMYAMAVVGNAININIVFIFSTLITSLIGILAAVFIDKIILITTILVVAILFTIAGFLKIKFFLLDFSWFSLIPFFIIPSLITAFKKRAFIDDDIKEKSLRKYWDKETTEQLLKGNYSFEPREQLLTTVFVNFCEYPLISEKNSVSEAFLLLRSVITEITEIIYQYDGIVISSNGSELIAIFGYEPNTDSDHAFRAVLAAIDIQKAQLAKNMSMIKLQKPVVNLKIGINTSSTYIGNLKDGFPLELVILGEGVSLAKFFEKASEPYSITIGAMTKDMLIDMDKLEIKTVKKLVQTKKNPAVFFEAHEITPCNEEEKNAVISYYRKYLGKQRKTERWALPPEVAIFVERAFSEGGHGKLINFSHDGLCISFNQYLGVGSHISLILDNESGNLKNSMKSLELLPIIAEVRWGKPTSSDTFIMGLEITNLTKTQRDAMVHLLRTCLSFKIKAAINQQ